MIKLLTFVFALALISSAMAEVPHQISYQGRLIDGGGAPLNGEHSITFTIYDLPELGSVLWTSGPQTVSLENGLFTYSLGQHEPIPDSVFLQHFERWLGITIDDGPEGWPRVFFNSTAFAYRAQWADGATRANDADNSEWALHATYADTAIWVMRARYSDSADWAPHAPYSDTASFSFEAGNSEWALHSVYADTAMWVTHAKYSDTADYADTATYALASAGGSDVWTGTGSSVTLTDENDFVGIGTASPVQKLMVDRGNILIRGAQMWGDVGDTAKLILGDGNHGISSVYGQGIRLWTFGDGTHSISFGHHNGNDHVIIGGSGNVAINTSVDINARLKAYQVSGPGRAAIQGDVGVSNPSFGGGIGVKGSFSSDGVGGTGVYGSATSASPLGGLVGVYGYTNDPTSYAIYSEGGMAATGPIATVTVTKSYGYRETYAVQSADNWCEDIGRGSLVDGVARVNIDPIFSETVLHSLDYHVFLTPLGDCGIFVADMAVDHFVVRALDQGACSIDFDYRIVAKRKGYEDRRLRSADQIVETTRSVREADDLK